MEDKQKLERIIKEYAEKQHYNPTDDVQYIVMEESFGELAQAIIDAGYHKHKGD